MSYKPTPTTADNFDDLKRYVNDQLLKIANELNPLTGTWTPAFSPQNGSVTYSHQSGNWVKINDLLFVEGKIELSGSTASGTVQITGLPEPIKSGHQGIFSFHYENYISLYAGLTGHVEGSVIHMREQNATGTENPNLTNNSLTKFTGFYRV